MKRDAPATARNRAPILSVLRRWLPDPARVLEVASGTGQHAAYFAAQLPHLAWYPSDLDEQGLESIGAWREEVRLPNLAAPTRLDVTGDDWPEGPFDAVFNANMIHISPWRTAEGLVAGAARVLAPEGLLLVYGPYKRDGRHTAPSNAAFDESLRARDRTWGVRDLEAFQELASGAGFERLEVETMPANNLMLVFRLQREDARVTGLSSRHM